MKQYPQFNKAPLALAIALALALPPAGAAPLASGARAGTEFKINTVTVDSQGVPASAMDADGDFVVVWEGQDNSYYGIYAQRYNSAGMPQGSEFKVNTTTTNSQRLPAVAMDADGDFVVAWDSSGQDGSYYGVYAQRYNSAGVAQGGEFRVNTTTVNTQGMPAVAMDADGDFVVTWVSDRQDGSGYGVYAKRYNISGVAQGSEFRVNTTTTNFQGLPAVAMDGDGDFVVAWQSYRQDGSGYGIYAQRYNRSGAVQGGEFRVNTTTVNQQNFPTLAMDADGDFAIAWQSYRQDASYYGIYAQRYNRTGAVQGGEFKVNTTTLKTQGVPAMAMDATGDLVVMWQSDQEGNYDIYGQRYNNTGAGQGSEFKVNTTTLDQQSLPTLTMDADGDFAIAWQSPDSSGNGIYAQRYAGPENVNLALSMVTTPNPVVPGGALSYSLTINNTHSVVAPTGFASIDRAIGMASGIKLSDVLPAGATFNSASGTNWNCGAVSGTVNCTLAGLLTPGALSTLNINVTAPNPAGSLTNTASVAGQQADTDTANNTVTQTMGSSLSINDVSVTEGDAGTVNAVFTVSLPAARSQTVTVNYATANGSASAPGDYAAKTGTLSFAPGQTAQTISVQVQGDNVDEVDETFLVNLSNPTNTTIGDGQGAATITDDDTAGTLQLSTSSISVNENAGTASLTVTRSGGSDGAVSAAYATQNGSATAPSDYTATTGTVSFANGEISKTITVPIINDTDLELQEGFTLNLSNPTGGATLGSPGSATVLIEVDEVVGGDVTVSFAAPDFQVNEAASTATVTVQRTGGLGGAVSVNYATSNGTAAAGSDYTTRTGTLNFAANQSTLSFSVPVANDTLTESSEIVNLTLSNPNGAVLGTRNTATLTIRDNEPSQLRFSGTTYSVNEGTPAATISVTRLGSVSSAASVNYATGGGDAIAGSDYTASSGTLNFAANQNTLSFTVPVLEDTLAERSDVVNLTLSNALGAALVSPTSATLTIYDNEPSQFLFTFTSYSVTEGTSSAVIRLSRLGDVSSPGSISYSTSNGTAIAGTDYTAVSGTLAFPVNKNGGVTFSIPIINDTRVEPTETVIMRLSNPVGGVLGVRPSLNLNIVSNE